MPLYFTHRPTAWQTDKCQPPANMFGCMIKQILYVNNENKFNKLYLRSYRLQNGLLDNMGDYKIIDGP